MKNKFWSERINYIISLPQGHQRDAVRKLRSTFPKNHTEQWNTEFDSGSLYEAWTNILPMQNIYGLNRKVIRDFTKEINSFTITEIGGGNGALWRNFLPEDKNITFYLIDQNPKTGEIIKSLLPKNVNFEFVNKKVQDTDIPPSDIIVSSLILHHIPGHTAEENLKYNIYSPGKLEIVKKLLDSVRNKSGILIINESDIYTDIRLKPKTPFLYQKLVDSYIRRACKAIIYTMEHESCSEELFEKLQNVIIYWALEQVERAGNAELPERDVYELDAIHWLELLESAKANIISHKNSDEWNLFHQYVIN